MDQHILLFFFFALIFLCMQHTIKLSFFCQCYVFYLSSSLLWWFFKWHVQDYCFWFCWPLLVSFKHPIETLFAYLLRHAGSLTLVHNINFYFYISCISWKAPLWLCFHHFIMTVVTLITIPHFIACSVPLPSMPAKKWGEKTCLHNLQCYSTEHHAHDIYVKNFMHVLFSLHFLLHCQGWTFSPMLQSSLHVAVELWLFKSAL